MAYKIDTDTCINCGLCISECPTDAISEGYDAHAIASDACIDCGACVSVCPQECISAE
ncbi:4Fe-4S binding protein [Candidatus Haliotispira prima]|uniref:Ferredoxin n=1 Tax=Candidatus Haliotispira prima TaxID=3034016 RepID=A0ABY8MEZ8_9SPIO|nr:4Fe-4S binding protein [Candidatus Haliotispira prima]